MHRDRSRRDFAFYAAKDVAMAQAAKCGVMLWDGKSKGTLHNILNLIRAGNKTLVYFAPYKTLYKLRGQGDLRTLLARRDQRDIERAEDSLAASRPHALQHRLKQMREGLLGEVYMTRGLCYKPRNTIGKTPVEPVPAGVDYDLWTGPAPQREFTKNRFHYSWHWFWDTGNGDFGNQGIHEVDICRWGWA